MKKLVVELTVNGAERQVLVLPGATLLDTLRDQGLTGTRRGCDQGACGACTVLVDGRPMMSCLLPVETIEGARVETIEGLTPAAGLHPIQAAFLEGFATQCGFCTSGMIMATAGLLAENPEPTREDAVRAISGNVCRCTGYAAIIDAVLDAAERLKRDAGNGEGGVMERIDAGFFADERAADLSVVGTTVQRADARGHVTGRTQFHEDVSFPDTLHLAMVRSTRHHAKFTLDTGPALAVPGVVRVLTHKDVPQNWYTILRLIGVGPNDEPVLPEDRVLFMGEQICAVLAETRAAALEGARRVRVDYEDLPAVFDVEEAIKAPSFKKDGPNYFVYEGHHCRRIRFGDVEKGFAAADHIIEQRYESSPIEHAPVETTGCTAKPEGERPGDGLYRHPGALLHARQHGADPRRAVQQAAPRRRHGRRRLRRQGRRDRRADRGARRDADQPAGEVRLLAAGGDAGLLAAGGGAALHQGRGDEGRAHRRPADHALRRRRRLLPALDLRHHQGGGAHAGPLLDPERPRRRLVRLHQPHAVVGDARLRRDDRRLRAWRARWTRWRGGWAWTRWSSA